jgi:uncharacterized membrane protein
MPCRPSGVVLPKSTGASDLWVFALSPPVRAQEALLAAGRLAARGALDLEDAAIVTNRRGRVRIVQTRDVNPSQGALGGAWLGTLAGLLAGVPFLGAAIGAAAGGLIAKLRDYGIDDAAMRASGIEPDLVRLSVGLEHPDDLIADLRRGLDAV